MTPPPAVSAALLAFLLVIFFSGTVEAAADVAGKEFPTTLRLERAIPRRGMEIEHLKARDLARYLSRGRNGRKLLGGSSVAGVVDFPVDGSANPFTVGYIVQFCYKAFLFFYHAKIAIFIEH